MIKTLTVIEVEKNERTYQLIVSPDSPLGEIFDVLTEMRALVVQKIEEACKEAPKPEEGK